MSAYTLKCRHLVHCSWPFPQRPGAELPEGAHWQRPEVRTEGKRLSAGVQHDAAVEPFAGDFTQLSEPLKVDGTDRCCGLDLDASQAAIVGLEHDVDLPPAVGTEVKELDSRPAPAELLRELACHEGLQERTHRRGLL